MIVVVNDGWLDMLNASVNAGAFAQIHLYQNNYTPQNTDTILNYTEADFSGYPGYIPLAFGAAFINGANQGEIDSPTVNWTHNGGPDANTVYGVYVTDAMGLLTFAESFGVPVVMALVGNTIAYTPKLTMIDQ